MGIPDHKDIIDQLHREVRSVARLVAFQFGKTAHIQGCCNSGKAYVLRKELDSFQINHHYTKPGISGRSTAAEVKGIWDALLADIVIVVDFQDPRMLDSQVVSTLRQAISSGGYVIVISDQNFTNDGVLVSQVSDHINLQQVTDLCRVRVNHHHIIEKWQQSSTSCKII